MSQAMMAWGGLDMGLLQAIDQMTWVVWAGSPGTLVKRVMLQLQDWGWPETFNGAPLEEAVERHLQVWPRINSILRTWETLCRERYERAAVPAGFWGMTPWEYLAHTGRLPTWRQVAWATTEEPGLVKAALALVGYCPRCGWSRPREGRGQCPACSALA